jgi:ribonuclease HI
MAENSDISIYTDGSCNPASGVGGWAAIVISGGKKTVVTGTASETSHQRMEITAAIQGILHCLGLPDEAANICVYTDSQYVAGLPGRREKLCVGGFKTAGGAMVRNADLLQRLYELMDARPLRFIKIQAHSRSNGQPDYNREADKFARKVMREFVKITVPK